MTDRDGHFTFVNEAFLKGLGYTKEEMLGKHFAIAHGEANPRELIREIGAKSLEKKGWRGECFFARKDGTKFPVALSVGPIVDRQKRVIGGFGLAKDITARRAAETSLRESEEQFRQLAENIHEVFFVVALDPVRFAYVSDAFEEVWGMSRQELYLRPTAWIDAVHPDDRERVSNFFGQSASGVAIDMQYRLVRPDGALRWISARTFPVHDEKGELHRVVGIAEDITVRKQEEAALRAAHQKLHVALRESEQRAKEASKLSELVDILAVLPERGRSAIRLQAARYHGSSRRNPERCASSVPRATWSRPLPHGATSSRRKKRSRQTAVGRCGAANFTRLTTQAHRCDAGMCTRQWRDTPASR